MKLALIDVVLLLALRAPAGVDASHVSPPEGNFCRDASKWVPSMSGVAHSRTCEEEFASLGDNFVAADQVCNEGTPPLALFMDYWAPLCCQNTEHVCSAFQGQICKDFMKFTPSAKVGGNWGDTTCRGVSRMIGPFAPSVETCAEPKGVGGGLLARSEMLADVAAVCCQNTEHVCSDYPVLATRGNICKYASKWVPSMLVGSRTCEEAFAYLGDFVATEEACNGENPPLALFMNEGAPVCCQNTEHVCSAFQGQICKDESRWSPFSILGGKWGGTTCQDVASMIGPFTPSVETCAGTKVVVGSSLSRSETLTDVAAVCCRTADHVCSDYAVPATRGNICKHTNKWDPFAEVGGNWGETTCRGVSRMIGIFTPSAKTCAEPKGVGGGLLTRSETLADVAAVCCQNTEHVCSDYPALATRGNICQHASKWVPSGLVGSRTCEDVFGILGDFVATERACTGEDPPLALFMNEVAPVCCQNTEHVCSAFQGQICKDESRWSPLLILGGKWGGTTCQDVATMMGPFTPSVNTCAEPKGVGGSSLSLSRSETLIDVAAVCCRNTEHVCSAYPVSTTRGNFCKDASKWAPSMFMLNMMGLARSRTCEEEFSFLGDFVATEEACNGGGPPLSLFMDHWASVCCQKTEHVCSAFRGRICKDAMKFTPSATVGGNWGGTTCGDVAGMLGSFTPGVETCAEPRKVGRSSPRRSETLSAMAAVCCQNTKHVCSDFVPGQGTQELYDVEVRSNVIETVGHWPARLDWVHCVALSAGMLLIASAAVLRCSAQSGQQSQEQRTWGSARHLVDSGETTCECQFIS